MSGFLRRNLDPFDAYCMTLHDWRNIFHDGNSNNGLDQFQRCKMCDVRAYLYLDTYWTGSDCLEVCLTTCEEVEMSRVHDE